MYLKGSFKGQNYGTLLGVHLKGEIDIDVDRDADSQYGWLSKLWSPCVP